MADRAVDHLIILMNRTVVEHTGGFSPVYGREVLEIPPRLRAAIEPIADNLDVPARLAPNLRAVLAQRGGQVADERQYLREQLTALVATCAGALERDDRLPSTPGSPEQDRLAAAVSRAYAVEATPGLLPKVIENGRPGDLGDFKWRVPEGDVLAARAMAVAVAARTGRQYQDVLTAQVAAGKGGAAPAAAEMLLN